MKSRTNMMMLLLQSSVTMLLMLAVIPTTSAARKRPPNILVLLADDLGIGDVGCYGNTSIRTPNIDRLAAEGVKLNHHIAAAPMCTPSRAAMMTSRYPARYGLVSNATLEVVVIPHTSSKVGLPLEEVTLATALKAANYTTALVGKWHLGMNCSLFGLSCPGPLNHGFDTFYGIPVTLFVEFRGPHPFWVFPIHQPKFQAVAVTGFLCLMSLILASRKFKWRLFSFVILLSLTVGLLFTVWFLVAHAFNPITLWGMSEWMHRFANSIILRQDKVVESPIKLDGLSQRLAAESRQFLADHAKDDKPFFLFHSFPHVHTPMFTAPHRVGVSKHGRFGDNIEEMDESIGVLLDSLKEFGLEEDTIVYFTSDQGGHLEAIDDVDGQRIGGYNGLFKGGKAQGGPEGGIRVAGIYRWPGHLPKGTEVNTPTNLMDLMPTVLELSGLPPMQKLVPRAADRELDGQSIAPLLKKSDVYPMEERVMIHHCRQAIHALRLTRGTHVYKMHLVKVNWHKGSTQCGWGHTTGCFCFNNKDTRDITDNPELYDLSVDPYEDYPIDSNTHEYKEIVGFLMQYLKDWRANVYYPPPPMSSIADVMWRPLYQPLCLSC